MEDKESEKSLNNYKKEDEKSSDAEKDKGINEGKFAEIGSKQAGEDHTEEEMKGSDADQAL